MKTSDIIEEKAVRLPRKIRGVRTLDPATGKLQEPRIDTDFHTNFRGEPPQAAQPSADEKRLQRRLAKAATRGSTAKTSPQIPEPVVSAKPKFVDVIRGLTDEEFAALYNLYTGNLIKIRSDKFSLEPR